MFCKLKNTISILMVVVFAIVSYIIAPEAAATWTDWIPITSAPSVYYEMTTPRTEYRSRTKTTTTSYSTSLSGYTQDGYTLVDNGSGNIDYVASFPSGFNTSHSLYSQYHKTPVSPSENSTTKTIVNTSTIGYIYWHWCRGDHVGAINRFINSHYSGEYPAFHAYFRSSALPPNSLGGQYFDVYQEANTSICDSTYWWYGYDENSHDLLEVKRCSYINYKKLYNYYKWSSWSAWKTTPITASDKVQVQTRQTARYRISLYPSEKKNPKLKVSKSNYSKTYGAKAFSLKVKRSGGGKITYSSKNKKVATVSAKGKVKIKGCGKATIKIKVAETPKYRSASKKITVTVKPSKVKIIDLKGNVNKCIVTFKKQNTVSGYQCVYNGSKKKNISSKATSVTITNYKKGTWIKIRAYKKCGKKKLYGAFGKVKPILR